MLRLFVLALLVIASPWALTERYVVDEDAFGNTTAAAYDELDDQQKAELSAQSSTDETTSDLISDKDSLPVDGDKVASPLLVEEETENSPVPQSKDGPEVNGSDLSSSSDSGLSSENPFERALREQQANETDEVVKRFLESGGDRSFDATKVNPADFVDSQDLLEGNVNSDGEQPFFVTYDNAGEANVLFYSPKVIQDEIDRRKVEEHVSNALVHQAESDQSEGLSLPLGADPVAVSIFSGAGEQSYFSRFIERCCQRLPNVGVMSLRADKPLSVPIKRNDLSYRFVDGDSRYRLVLLPKKNKDYLLTIKAFVRSYKNLGVKSGAFIPQIVLLDGDKKVTRIISNIDARFHAETWTSYGYLKAVIEVEQTGIDAERFLLLYTRADDLRTSTTIEDSSGSLEIDHMEIGTIEVAVVESSLY